jgi:ppGpp synthetase/RelA/SpoT-type nucleotidyltranferase
MEENSDLKIQELMGEYKGKIESYKGFAKSISSVLGYIVKRNDFSFLPIITFREKDVLSLEEKLKRQNKDGKIYLESHNIKGLNDLEDLAGVRVIFYLESEANKFIQSVYEDFGEENVQIKQKIERGGYGATHLIVSLSEDRLKLAEYKEFRGMRCEIQLTTVLNHAWSEVEHKIIYKPEEKLKQLDIKAFKKIEAKFKDVMENHIKAANQEFEAINYLYSKLKGGVEIFDENYLLGILKYNSNNEIFRQLDVFDKYLLELGDKMSPEQDIIKILNEIKEKTRVNKMEDEKTMFGIMQGKSYTDVLNKILDIIEKIRYSRFPQSLDFLVELYGESTDSVKRKIEEIVKKIVEYNYSILKNHGIGLQIEVFKKILSWSSAKKIKNLQLINIICKEIIDPSCGGIERSGENTWELKNGFLNPNANLIKLRRRVMGFLFGLLHEEKDLGLKLMILKVLRVASQFPMSGDYGEDFEQMVMDDVMYLIEKYKNIILNDRGQIVVGLPVVKEIEEQLCWFKKRFGNKLPVVQTLLNLLRGNKTYAFFRLFAGNAMDYEGNGGFKEGKKRQTEAIEEIIKNISRDNFGYYEKLFNNLASYKDFIEEWKLSGFNFLLRRFAAEKTELAGLMMDDAFNNGREIKNFIDSFLCGFRVADDFELWDKYVAKLIEKKSPGDVISILNSFFCVDPENLTKHIRKIDIDLLKCIVERSGDFEYLKTAPDNVVLNLHYKLMGVLLVVFRIDEKEVEKMIVTELRNIEDKNYSSNVLQEIGFAMHDGKLNVEKWEKDSINFIFDILVKIDVLDYSVQEVLTEIGRFFYEEMINIFWKRIVNNSLKYKNKKGAILGGHYEAIPYDLNNELRDLISANPKCKEIIKSWIEKIDLKDKIFNWELGIFIQRVRGPIKEILDEMVETGDLIKINKVLDLFGLISTPNFDLCFKILEKTNDVSITRRVKEALYREGVVHGEFGMAEAYKKKLGIIKQYKEKYTKDGNASVLKFIEEISKNLEDDTLLEERRVEKDLKIRKLEYESEL